MKKNEKYHKKLKTEATANNQKSPNQSGIKKTDYPILTNFLKFSNFKLQLYNYKTEIFNSSETSSQPKTKINIDCSELYESCNII